LQAFDQSHENQEVEEKEAVPVGAGHDAKGDSAHEPEQEPQDRRFDGSPAGSDQQEDVEGGAANVELEAGREDFFPDFDIFCRQGRGAF